MARTCNLPTLEIYILSQSLKNFELTVACLPGILSCSILQPWRDPLSAGMVTVKVKASDWSRFPGVIISLTKDSTSELSRTLEYQWPLPGSSRNLKFKQYGCGLLLLNGRNSPHIRSGIPSAKNAHKLSCIPNGNIFIFAPLWECHWHICTIVGRSHPCIANIGVSTRFEIWRSLSSGVKDDSKIPRKEGSMKWLLLQVQFINVKIFLVFTQHIPRKR